MNTFTPPAAPAACCLNTALQPSGTALRRIDPPTLDRDGFMLGRLPRVEDPGFQALQQAEYARFRPGENAANRLARRTGWGVYVNDAFHWHERETYSLSAELNPEEAGRVRRFERIGAEFLAHPMTEAVLRAVFHAWGHEKTSAQALWQVQLSAIRYEPTVEAPAWPSPIAPHQDEVDGAIVVLHRTGNLVGGLSRLYALDRRPLVQADLAVGDVLFVRDAAVLHQVTPLMLEPGADWSAGARAYRDVLLVRFQTVGR